MGEMATIELERLETAGRYFITGEEYVPTGPKPVMFRYAIYHEDGRRIFRAVNLDQARALLTSLCIPKER